ncbi:MAG TPA: PH domain-containing protein [Candidatus Hydrogenedens sp.]|nr:PH domain-containing protein [Candidatus Hydrogenedens sp.]HOK08451.1 PH domain-containing protein [Candidatus Hydrogenedens sp.]HOL20284.1 PH domain-containing protein [Candidatus Hydrogenedens sp.]HPP58136.1 PH domain-containing protein [Candidatus Hydrogenedens sp.]
MSEEKIIWSGTPSQVLNLWIFIICLLTCFLIIPIFYALWKWLVVKCTKYVITTERIKITTGVFSTKTDYLELYRINDITFEQPFLLRIFSLGNLKLTTSDTSTPELTLQAIPASEELQNEIRKCIETQRDKKRARVIDYT